MGTIKSLFSRAWGRVCDGVMMPITALILALFVLAAAILPQVTQAQPVTQDGGMPEFSDTQAPAPVEDSIPLAPTHGDGDEVVAETESVETEDDTPLYKELLTSAKNTWGEVVDKYNSYMHASASESVTTEHPTAEEVEGLGEGKLDTTTSENK